jgi:hypothetical protein
MKFEVKEHSEPEIEVKEHSEPDVRQYPYIVKHPKGFLVFFNIGGGGQF